VGKDGTADASLTANNRAQTSFSSVLRAPNRGHWERAGPREAIQLHEEGPRFENTLMRMRVQRTNNCKSLEQEEEATNGEEGNRSALPRHRL